MWMNRVVVKLGASIILLFLIVLLPLGFVIHQVFTGFYYQNIQQDADELSHRYAETIASNPSPAMAVSMIEMMSQYADSKLYIVDTAGKVIANSGVTWMPAGSVLPKEKLAWLFNGQSMRQNIESPDRHQYLVSGTPIILEETVIGGVVVLSSIEGIEQSIQRMRQLLILSGIGAFFLAIGFTLILSKKLAAPLIQMEKATRRIAKGELNTRVHVPSGDEIGSLATAINDLAKDLQTYTDTRKEFFANISHELRTPMTYLDGYSTVLKNNLYDSEEEKDHYLEILSEESKRLIRLIQDLFDLAKIEEGKVNLDQEWVDLSEMVHSTVLKVSLKAKDKGLVIRQDIKESLPLVYVDPLRVEQIMINLLDNAIRYTHQGSIDVVVFRHAITVDLIVKDTGMGIPEEDLPFIYDRLYRVEKSRSRESGGSGLGLAIVKKLVEMQGGSIKITSQVGQGTTCIVSFPGGGEG